MTRKKWFDGRRARAAVLSLAFLLAMVAVQVPATCGGATAASPSGQEGSLTSEAQEHQVYLPFVCRSHRVFLPHVMSPIGDSPLAGELSAFADRWHSTDGSTISGFVTREGEDLQLNGEPYAFVGINASYLIGPYFPPERMEEVISFLAAHGVEVLRVWVEPRPYLDTVERMLDLGAKYGVRFVMTLHDFFGHTDGWWFKSRYETESLPWIRTLVPRFAHRPEILMWELMNEPTCPGADANRACWDAMLDWAQVTSEEVKRLDPNHLVSVGMQRAGFDQQAIDTFRKIHALDSIDIVSVHSEGGRVAQGARQLEREIAHDLGKPVFFGEVYVRGHDKSCQPLGNEVLWERALTLVEDIEQSQQAGVDGYLLWQYAFDLVDADGDCSRRFCGEYDYYADDHVWDVLAQRQ